MSKYSYQECLETSYRVNWKIEDVLGKRSFDPAKRWLPTSLSGASGIVCLSDEELIKLTHVEMAAYAHLFGYVEEFIAPKISSLADDFAIEGREKFDALSNFVAEEVKHMILFKKIRKLVDGELGFGTELVGNEKETAAYVLSKNTGAVLLLTSVIEWFTQRHFQEAFKDDQGLDDFTRDIFKAHWLEESQHAKMDHLETLRAFEAMNEAEKDQAIDDLIELVGAVKGLLEAQAELDVNNFETYIGRKLNTDDRQEVLESVLRAKLWTFIESGTTHANFLELFMEVTNEAQQVRVTEALQAALSAPAGAAV